MPFDRDGFKQVARRIRDGYIPLCSRFDLNQLCHDLTRHQLNRFGDVFGSHLHLGASYRRNIDGVKEFVGDLGFFERGGHGTMLGHHLASIQRFRDGDLFEVGKDHQVRIVAGRHGANAWQLPVLGSIPCGHANGPYRIEPGGYREAKDIVHMPNFCQVVAIAIVGGKADAWIRCVGNKRQQFVHVLLAAAFADHDHQALA